MRVLIVLSALATVAFASTGFYGAPLAYTTSYEPRTSYEYSSSVHAPDYKNFVSVRSSDEPILRTFASYIRPQPIFTAPTFVKSEPILAKASYEPFIDSKTYFAAPVVAPVIKSEPLLTKTVVTPAAPFVHTIASGPATYAAPFVPTLDPVIRPIVKTHTPLVKTVTPIVAAAPEPIVTVHTPEPSIVAVRTHQPHSFIAAAPLLKTITPVVHSVVEPQVVGSAIIGDGLLPHKSMYHSQDELGQAAYGHAEPLQSHDAVQDALGNKAGSFSYVAPDGRLLTTNYIADENGYRVASNAFPVAEEPKLHHRRRRSIAHFETPLLKESVLTQVVNNPGHAFSYRVDPIEATPELKTLKTISAVPAYQPTLIRQSPFIDYGYHPSFYATPYLSSPYAHPLAFRSFGNWPALRDATLTNVVHTPGHAASYRID